MKVLTGIVATLLCIAVTVQQWQIRQMAEMIGMQAQMTGSQIVEGVRIDSNYILDLARRVNDPPPSSIQGMNPIDRALLCTIAWKVLGSEWTDVGYEDYQIQCFPPSSCEGEWGPWRFQTSGQSPCVEDTTWIYKGNKKVRFETIRRLSPEARADKYRALAATR